MEIFPVISLFAEVLIIVIAAVIALKKKKAYGWLFAVSYAVFLFYDVLKFLKIAMNGALMDFVLLVGAVLSLVAVWQIFKEK